MKKIIVFASGSGTNAEALIKRFQNHSAIEVTLVVSNRRDAKVLDRAKGHGVATITVNKSAFAKAEILTTMLRSLKPDLIVLAGFLWKIPDHMTEAFEGRMINLHPALLPKYGGKGMYGMNVHKAVIANKDKESGITIHYVNERYDEGRIIAQESLKVEKQDTPESLAEKIHALEHRLLAETVENLLS